ncbi:hypothetical protein Tco_0005813 [Tanacetum coccineum]
MAASGSSRAIARCAMDDIAYLSGETEVLKYMSFFFLQQISEDKAFGNLLRDQAETARNCIDQLHVMICDMEAMVDCLVVFDSLDFLNESKDVENNKLKALNDLIAQTEEAIRLKEGHVEVMDEVIRLSRSLIAEYVKTIREKAILECLSSIVFAISGKLKHQESHVIP